MTVSVLFFFLEMTESDHELSLGNIFYYGLTAVEQFLLCGLWQSWGLMACGQKLDKIKMFLNVFS